MIKRKMYLQKLIGFKDKDLIKVVTGVRRCGKSTLFKLFQQYLRENGVSGEQIQSINLEDINYEELTDYRKLHQHIESHLIKDKMNYIFLDEIQNVLQFEKAVDSLYIKDNVDLYVTGSNAHLLSGELATLLSGRYVEIKMLPLSFQEYLSAETSSGLTITRKYAQYLQNSSFPYAMQLQGEPEQLQDYLQGIMDSIILKDVVARKNISDIDGLKKVIRFLFDNIGNVTSLKKISDTIRSDGYTMAPQTVENYVSALVDSFILYPTQRYDVKGKEYLRQGEKYYVVDIGLRYLLLGRKGGDSGHILENIVYLELLRRGYKVYVGKVGSEEVDFVAVNAQGVEYYQVSETVRGADTLARELRPLENIRDHNPKFLLTMDDEPEVSHNGIRQLNVLDWLLKD